MAEPSQALDNLTNTFTADRKFFDALMTQPCGEAFVEMCVWFLWLHEYLHDIQSSLHESGKTHGPHYQVWVVSMIGGAAQSIGMLMYLVARGVVHEGAGSGRRALEYLGMACHLVRDPALAKFLQDAESAGFTKAFIRGPDRQEAERLKQNGIRYRFAGMNEATAQSATQLYEIFSRFNVHGGTMSSLTGISHAPTPHSCFFHNRSLDEVSKNLLLFKPVVEITAMELMELVGRYGTRTKRTNEAGACVLVWLDRKDPRWMERLQAVREALGLESTRNHKAN